MIDGPATFVERQPSTVEAMLITADNHAAAARWVESKGGGWHTYSKSWGDPGFGFSDSGSDETRFRSVKNGQMLVWGSGVFHAANADRFFERYVPAREPDRVSDGPEFGAFRDLTSAAGQTIGRMV